MVGGGLIGAAEMAEALAQIRRFGERPDAAIWYAVAYAEGVR